MYIFGGSVKFGRKNRNKKKILAAIAENFA